MRVTKEEKMRREGMAYAYHLAKKEGIEALESRLLRNEITTCPAFCSDKQQRDFENAVKVSYFRMVMAVALSVIEEKFGADAEKMDEVADGVAEIIDSIYGGWLSSHKDLEEYLLDEFGIDLTKYLGNAEHVCDVAEGKMSKRTEFVDGKKQIPNF